jgi:hypothetical protein
MEMVRIGVADECASVIHQQLFGRAAEVPEAGLNRFENRGLRVVEADRVVLAAAVAERQPERDDPGQFAADLERVRRPIELPLTPRWRLIANRRFASDRRRPQLLQIRVQRGRATRVAEGCSSRRMREPINCWPKYQR